METEVCLEIEKKDMTERKERNANGKENLEK